MGAISDFIRHHYRHFNGAALVDAADAYVKHLDGGGKMLVTLAGAMSTAELGLSLAEMIRRGKVHAICCTGANLEEDIFNLVAHDHYVRIPNYRAPLARAGGRAARPAPEPRHRHLHPRGRGDAPHRGRRARRVAARRQGGRAASSRTSSCTRSCARACSKSTTRSIRRTAGCWPRPSATCRCSCRAGRTRRSATSSPAHCIAGDIDNVHTVRTGIEYMMSAGRLVSGDVPQGLDRLLPDRRRHRRRLPDLRRADAAAGPAAARTRRAGATSARSATRRRATARTRAPCRTRRSPGASSSASTPKFIIESDATIVAPLIFAHVLGE